MLGGFHGPKGEMARSKGDISNFSGHELAEARKNLKAVLQPPKHEEAVEELFETLAEWNKQLEKYTPHFQKPREPEL